MNKLSDNKNLMYIILCFVGVIAVFIFAIMMLVSIWSGDSNVENENTETQNQTEELNYDDIKPTGKYGVYNTVSWNTEKQVNYYSRWICDALKAKNVARINELVSKEYKDYYSLDEAKLIKTLETKGLWGKTLEIDTYEYAIFGDNKVFKLHIKSSDNSVDDYINLIEYSPKEVTISFDSFVTINKEAKEYIRDNVTYTFTNELYLDTKYKVNLNVKNNSDSEVILNAGNEYENIYLDFTTLTSEKVISTVFAGETIHLKPNAEFNAVLEFDLQDLAFSKIKGVTLKNVTFAKNNVTKDVVIEF